MRRGRGRELRAAHPSKLSRLRFGRQSPQSLSSGYFCQRPIAGSVRCSSKIDLSHDTDFIVDAVGRIDVWPSAPGTSKTPLPCTSIPALNIRPKSVRSPSSSVVRCTTDHAASGTCVATATRCSSRSWSRWPRYTRCHFVARHRSDLCSPVRASARPFAGRPSAVIGSATTARCSLPTGSPATSATTATSAVVSTASTAVGIAIMEGSSIARSSECEALTVVGDAIDEACVARISGSSSTPESA